MAQPSAPARARWLALLLPAGLLGGALISQYGFGLFPCEMCHWQRWPHYAALLPGLVAVVSRDPRWQRAGVWLAALAVSISGAIGIFHAGVEYGWWEGLTTCTASSGGGSLDDLFNQPVIRCDVPQWTLMGVSLAGFNALFSLGGAAMMLWWLRPRNA